MRRPFLLVALLVLVGAGAGIYLALAGGGGRGGPARTTATATGPSTAARFQRGRCVPGGCVAMAVRRYNLNVPDADPSGCGSTAACGPPATVAPDVYLSRPRGLADAPAPLLIAFSSTVPHDPNWLAASASGPAGPYVYASIPPEHGCARVCSYAHPTVTAPGMGELPNACGASGTLTCDDIPLVAGLIRALEGCDARTAAAGGPVGTWVAAGRPVPAYGEHARALRGNGAPPCQHIDPREVFVEGGSKGGVMALDVACDTRTTRAVAGISDASERVLSPGESAATPPNCPGLLAATSACVTDCAAASANTAISLQWIWGSADPAAVAARYCDATNPAVDCLGNGYAAGAHWSFGDVQLASTALGGPGLGCATTPAGALTTGAGGRIAVTTYTGCTTPGAATQTVDVYGGGHLPDTWPTDRWPAGIACTRGCHERNASSGLVVPLAAWRFWLAHDPLLAPRGAGP